MLFPAARIAHGCQVWTARRIRRQRVRYFTCRRCVGKIAAGQARARSIGADDTGARLPIAAIFAAKGVQPLTPEIEQSLKAKDSFKECDSCPDLVVVPKGSFTMGTPAGEPQREPGEHPQHKVAIAQPFAVGRFAISFDEWDACLADGGCDGFKGSEEGFGRGRLPAAGISFAATKSYLTWI